MAEDFLDLMRLLAPDLAEEMGRRALLLERVAALQPVGRRQLSARLNLPEREIRALAGVLKDNGFIHLDASGMTLTEKADGVLAQAREFSRSMRGLTYLEMLLSRLFKIPKVYVAAGDADEDELNEIAALTGGKVFDGSENLAAAFREVRGYN